ncbi:MAG: transposase, partial [Candidatus Omnitrophica bacterium]|nr:transposase [Candidatus Omnitrophota bacterium]
MARIGRVYSGCYCYHIITRGNQKQNVFLNEKDYARYVGILKRAKRKYNILLFSYCLMPNHVHLLIETKSSSNMSNFMRWINRGYAAYFNTAYQKTGHLWQGR